MITNIYFDWGNTLGYHGHKNIFINGNSYCERISALFPDALFIIDYLYKKGYKLGIISNTKKTKKQLVSGLKKNNMSHYFNASIICTNGDTICKKGCSDVFYKALQDDKVKPENCIMIGNNYKQDIIGALNVGMHAIFIKRPDSLKGGKECIKINNLKDLSYFL